MEGFARLIAALMGVAIVVIFIVLVLATVRAVWRFLLKLAAPDEPSPRVVASVARAVPPQVSVSRTPTWTPDPSPITPPSALSGESEGLEIRVSVGLNHGIGRRLIVEVWGWPLPAPAGTLVYVVTALSYEQGKEYPLRVRPTDNQSSQPFSSVHARPPVARLREEWTVLTFIDLDAVYPARSGRQSYVFTCRVHRPGQDIAVGLPGPQGRAIETASATAYLDLADFGYLDLDAWVNVREDAVTFLAKVLYQCDVETDQKWERLADWVGALFPAGAPQVVQAQAKKRLVNYYRALRAAPSTSSNRSQALGQEATPDFQRELVGVARGLVDGEPMDSQCRQTYESLRAACRAALSTWVDRDKEPLPPRRQVAPSRPPVAPLAPKSPQKPAPKPKPLAAPVAPPVLPPRPPRQAPLPQPWEPDPVPVPLRVVDQEMVAQMRAVLSMARVAAVLGFSNTTHAQDKILDKFKRRLIDRVPDEATRARVEADLQACLDEATAVIGQLSYFKRRLDAAVNRLGFHIRDLLGKAMHELIMARAECSADGVGLYGYGSRKYTWAPLPVRRPKPSPRPAPAPKPRPVPRPKAPVKPLPVPKSPQGRSAAGTARPAPTVVGAALRPPVQPASPRQASVPPSPVGVPTPPSLAELKARVSMPPGLDRTGQIAFIREQFDRWNSLSLTTRNTAKRHEIAQRLRCLAQLQRLLK